MQFSDKYNSLDAEIFALLNAKKVELEAQGKKIYNLSVGTPDFKTADHIMNTLRDEATNPENWKYTLRDIPEMLDAVCYYYKDRFGVDITPDMVCSCPGSQEGLGLLGQILCNKGDIILLPTPCYPAFITCAKLAEAEPYYYPMVKENNFLPDVSSIPKEVARKAKFMIVSLPSNPMGSVGTPEVYKEIIEFGKKYDIIIIHDNAYSDIVFDGNTCGSFLNYEGAAEVGAEFFSLSKSFNVTGARLSFFVGNPELVGAFRKFRKQIDFGMFMPMQKVAIAILRGPREQVKKQCADYQERRDALCGSLREIGWDLDDSHGSMFVWAPIPEGHGSSMDFCMELIDKAGVICTPGECFGPLGAGYVRFGLTMPPEKIREAVKAIADSGILMK